MIPGSPVSRSEHVLKPLGYLPKVHHLTVELCTLRAADNLRTKLWVTSVCVYCVSRVRSTLPLKEKGMAFRAVPTTQSDP